MADLSVRSLMRKCIGKSGTLSVRRDVLGVYGDDNPNDRLLKHRLNLIKDRPFVRIAVVSITDRGSGITQQAPSLQRDLDDTNDVYQDSCNVWVYCTGSLTIERNDLIDIDLHDCMPDIHQSSPDEFALFSLGRNLGANIVGYYVRSMNPNRTGCAAHPDGLKGFMIIRAAFRWAFVHELSHVIAFSAGDAGRITGHSNDPNNVMFDTLWTTQPTFTDADCDIIVNDEDFVNCP